MKSKIAVGIVGSSMFALIVTSFFCILMMSWPFQMNPIPFFLAFALAWGVGLVTAIQSSNMHKAWNKLMNWCGVALLVILIIRILYKDLIIYQLNTALSANGSYPSIYSDPAVSAICLVSILITNFSILLLFLFFFRVVLNFLIKKIKSLIRARSLVTNAD